MNVENRMHIVEVLGTVVPVAILLLAVLDWRYIYYQVLRLVVA